MVKQRVIWNVPFGALPFHYVHRVMQDAFDEKIARLSHQHPGLREVPERHRQGAAVVLMAMRDCDGIHVLLGHLRI